MAICSNGIALVEVSAYGGKILDKQFYPFDSAQDDGGDIFNGLLNKVLAKHSKNKSQQLEVILSSDFVRFMVLPRQSSYLSAAERAAYADALYKEVYGNLSEQWSIAIEDAPPYHPALCAAIDNHLLDQIKQIAIQHRFRLSSVGTHATSVINQLNLHNFQGCLAIVEPSRLVFVEFNHSLKHIQQLKWQGNWITPLQKILRKTQLSSHLAKNQLLIYAPFHPQTDIPSFDEWHVNFCKPATSMFEGSAHFQMILGNL